jgi:hypothetical protein
VIGVHDHAVVLDKVDSFQLVHAGLLSVKSVGLHPDSTPPVTPERREAGHMIIQAVASYRGTVNLFTAHATALVF